jgi:hypothetical protein
MRSISYRVTLSLSCPTGKLVARLARPCGSDMIRELATKKRSQNIIDTVLSHTPDKENVGG